MSSVAVTIEPAGPCRLKMAIEVPATDVDAAWREVVAQVARSARLPGFRPGRAPAALVQKKYAQQIEEELRDWLTRFGFREAVRQAALDVVAPVEVSNKAPLLSGAPFAFTVTVDVAPRFELPAWKGIELEGRTPAVTDEEVEAAVTAMRERLARYVTVEGRTVRAEDFARVDYEGRTGETPLAQRVTSCPDAASCRDRWVMVAEANDLFPGFREVLIGMAVGETREMNVVFPADFPVSELAGLQALYTVTLKEIRERQLPPMDEEFFRSIKVANEAELRQRMRASLESQKQQEEQRRRRQTVIQWLLDHTPMEELPQSEVDAETRLTVSQLVQDNIRRGVSEETLRQHSDALLEAAATSSRARVRLDYILSRIADQENIQVTDEEIMNHLKVLAALRNEPLEKVQKEVAEQGRQEEIRAGLRRSKALERVMDAVVWKITEKGTADAES